jgi:hypothetical protein
VGSVPKTVFKNTKLVLYTGGYFYFLPKSIRRNPLNITSTAAYNISHHSTMLD